MNLTREDFERALVDKNIPLLTLDNKWHQVFGVYKQNRRIKKLESQLNDLLKLQGKYTTERKEIKRLKTKLMKEIVESMDEIGEEKRSPKLQKKLDDKTRLINECNEKLEYYKHELAEIPAQIKAVNYELMLETVEICYGVLTQNEQEIKEITDWLKSVRIELKKNVIRKQEKETESQRLYSYMHDIFGAEVMELFDMEYLKKEDDK